MLQRNTSPTAIDAFGLTLLELIVAVTIFDILATIVMVNTLALPELSA